jgi:ADP-ribose pyrophosphatase
MRDPNIPIPKTLKSKSVYKGYFEIKEELLKLPLGPEKTYSILLTPSDAAVVLAETASGELVLNKEYRPPTKNWLYGCPGGSIDEGETPMEAARRELLEETGYDAEEFHLMGSAYPFPGSCGQQVHYFLAKGAKQSKTVEHEPFELIEVELKSETLLNEEIRKGALTDGILCTALYFKALFQKT